MVGEMHAHVQGASLKACMTALSRFFYLPDHQHRAIDVGVLFNKIMGVEIMSNRLKKAVIYCRTACTCQDQTLSKVIEQETQCRLYADRQGYEVVQAFHDNGESGLTINRPSFRLMLVTLLAAPEPYIVITTAMDRLSRDVNDFASICKIVGGLGGEFVFTEDETLGGRAA
jgi:hypothetical protein